MARRRNIHVDPETYAVTVDGALITCAPVRCSAHGAALFSLLMHRHMTFDSRNENAKRQGGAMRP